METHAATETHTSPVTPTAVGIRYGLLTGLVSIVFSFILFATEADQSPVRWLGLGILVVGMVLAHKAYKQGNRGFMDFGEGLAIGTIMSVVSGTLSTAFNYVYMTFIEPDYMSRLMEQTRIKMEEKGGLTDEQIDQAVGMMQKFSSGAWMLLLGIAGSLLIGLLIALVVSAVTKNARPEFE